MKSYHFSLGNSDSGAIGYCAEVKADSPEEAVEIIREQVAGGYTDYDLDYDERYFGHLMVMLNPDAITIDDIEYTEDA